MCFAFRGDPPLKTEATEVEVLEMDVFFSMDLLALAAGLGHGSTSNAICLWCRCDAEEWKIAAAGKATYALRTRASEAADLETFKAKTKAAADLDRKKKAKGDMRNTVCVNNFKGVSAVSHFDVEFDHITPPYLHLVLGVTNDCVKEMLRDLLTLGCLDPKAALRQLERIALAQELEFDLAKAVAELVDLVGAEAGQLVRDMVKKMDKASEPEPSAEGAAGAGAAAQAGAVGGARPGAPWVQAPWGAHGQGGGGGL